MLDSIKKLHNKNDDKKANCILAPPMLSLLTSESSQGHIIWVSNGLFILQLGPDCKMFPDAGKRLLIREEFFFVLSPYVRRERNYLLMQVRNSYSSFKPSITGGKTISSEHVRAHGSYQNRFCPHFYP